MVEPQAAADRLLLLHADAVSRGELARAVECLGMSITHASSLTEATALLRQTGGFAVVVVSIGDSAAAPLNHGDAHAVQALRSFVRDLGGAEVIVLAEQSLKLEDCCDLVRLGISGFLDARQCRPGRNVLRDRIIEARRRFVQSGQAAAEIHASAASAEDGLIWRSRAMADLLDRGARTAQVSDVPILIYGESGTGKQLLAEFIHRLDPKRGTRRFLSVNCSAITGTLAESTLFGHVKGAFTGATSSRKGIFRAAEGGTVLLDEIGEMDLALQPKLLRVLQEGVVMPLGSDDELECDVRVIAATNRRLAAVVEEERFRLDLYQRLNVISLEIPPLRERREDIPSLVRFFLKKYSNYYERPIESVDPRVYEFLSQCTLRGNVRELENAVRQTLAFKSAGTELKLEDIPPAILANGAPSDRDDRVALTELVDAACQLVDTGKMTLPELVSTCEKLILRSTLQRSNRTSTDLAKQLGLSRRTLYNKIHKYRLAEPDRAAPRAHPDHPRSS